MCKEAHVDVMKWNGAICANTPSEEASGSSDRCRIKMDVPFKEIKKGLQNPSTVALHFFKLMTEHVAHLTESHSKALKCVRGREERGDAWLHVPGGILVYVDFSGKNIEFLKEEYNTGCSKGGRVGQREEKGSGAGGRVGL